MINIFFMTISGIATVVNAVYAVKAHYLSKEIKNLNKKNNERDEKFKKQLKVLYKAIVISNLSSAGSTTEDKVKDFMDNFKDENNKLKSFFDDII